RLDGAQLAVEGARDLSVVDDLHPPAAPLHPCDRLAHLPDGPALERERARIDDRLVADLKHPQPDRLAGGQVAAGGGGEHQVPAALLAEAGEALQDLRRAPLRADRITRYHRRLPQHPVGEEAAGCEIQSLVLPKGERIEGVDAVGSDYRLGPSVL